MTPNADPRVIFIKSFILGHELTTKISNKIDTILFINALKEIRK